MREKLGTSGKLGEQVSAANVHVQLATGKQYEQPGKVNFVDVTVDQGTDTVPVRATFPNPDRILIDGQLVNVTVEGGSPQNMLVIPQAAVQLDQSGPYVLVVNSDKKVETRRIEAGPPEGSELPDGGRPRHY
ncbi:multidrug efflux pump subunit AcrA (membrane-fusion protein) [Rhizobium tibeticum]|uniref:efflux RND transporter periplasmic adaptor subunit n=1 Tax=Rhizobium tibeticum TaxID=501024 RepID=UPI00277ECB43|nr:hypothetical protein [Rhizobium tibeticum]MDP9809699.1 multidrug efflux pump subunit AcrA (membrane-fusion protein) [Rhizobium tibeticum]